MVSRPLIAQGYSLAEEIANSISHGIGLVFGIVGLVLLLVQAVDANASAMAITSYSLYGGSMILLFLASTLYHAIPHQRAKMWLKKFDHCAIYLLIAGTYTPFLLVGLNSPLSRGLMIVIWSLALLGILFKLTIAHRFKVLSLVTYLTMGWLSLIVVYQLAIKLSIGGVTLLALGGVVYSLGVIFYVCKRIPYNHAIWHGFVLGGISFKKGCYTGQEMVARAKFRGANKRALWTLAGHASRVPEAGEDLELKMGENWRRTGTVLAAVQLDDGRLLVQAVMNNDMEADSVFRVRDDANTLSIEPLPYSLEE